MVSQLVRKVISFLIFSLNKETEKNILFILWAYLFFYAGNLVFHTSYYKFKMFVFEIRFQNMDKDNGQEFGLRACEIVHVINFIGSPDSGTIQEVTLHK